GIGFGGAQRVRHAGQPDARTFDFADALEDGAEPLSGREDGWRDAVAMRGAEDDGIAAPVVEGDLLRFLEERRATLLVGIDREGDGFDRARRLAVSGSIDTRDRDQARDRLILRSLGGRDNWRSYEETQEQTEHKQVTHRRDSLEN